MLLGCSHVIKLKCLDQDLGQSSVQTVYSITAKADDINLIRPQVARV